MKLRQRKQQSILPQHTSDRLLASTRRRKGRGKRRRRQISWPVVSCCFFVVLIIVILLYENFPAPQHPAIDRARNFAKNKVSQLMNKVRASEDVPYTKMTCSDGVTIGYLNDNYCDCLSDGADEPTTSACAHVTVARPVFHCGGDSDTVVFASRVGDGVEDCRMEVTKLL